jgi:RNA polymerase sigma-70 factor (ECF subfamily)
MASLDLEHLYDEHAQALFAFLLNFTRDEADTRDLLQEIFIKLAKTPALMDGVRDQRGFLIRISHHAAIDVIRRRGTRTRNHEQFAAEFIGVFAHSDDPDEQVFRTSLTEAMGNLPSDQRAVLHLKLWEGRTFEEVAAILEISQNTASSRYRYGIDKLRERLRPLYNEIK